MMKIHEKKSTSILVPIANAILKSLKVEEMLSDNDFVKAELKHH